MFFAAWDHLHGKGSPLACIKCYVFLYLCHFPIWCAGQVLYFGTKLYRQVVGIPMGTNCASLVADLFLFFYERDFMMSLSDDKQADVIDAFNNTSRYLDDLLNINNVYFDNMVSQIYPSELQLNKDNNSDTKATLLDLHLSISYDIGSTKIYVNVTTLILKLSISHF